MKKALVIDDDEIYLELLCIVLSKEGFTVVSTADAPQGVLLFKQHRPAIVLLDLGLPSMSGLEVLKEIRQFDPAANVIVITGYGSAESAAASMRMGALEFIEKTADLETMIRKIKAAVQKADQTSNQ